MSGPISALKLSVSFSAPGDDADRAVDDVGLVETVLNLAALDSSTALVTSMEDVPKPSSSALGALRTKHAAQTADNAHHVRVAITTSNSKKFSFWITLHQVLCAYDVCAGMSLIRPSGPSAPKTATRTFLPVPCGGTVSAANLLVCVAESTRESTCSSMVSSNLALAVETTAESVSRLGVLPAVDHLCCLHTFYLHAQPILISG